MQFNIEKLLFFDIESVSQYEFLKDLPEEDLKQWLSYYDNFRERVTDESKIPKEDDYRGKVEKNYIKDLHNEVYRQTAAFFPEFGKVACVSMAFVTKDGNVKFESFCGQNEVEVLMNTRKIFDKVESLGFELCGQNIKNFDIPFLAKRFVINGLKPPKLFPTHNTKPWELKVLDTRDVWNFGGRSIGSLDLICSVLKVDSPKNGEVKGDNVTTNFWEGKYEEIKTYCQKDVKALVDIITKFNNLK